MVRCVCVLHTHDETPIGVSHSSPHYAHFGHSSTSRPAHTTHLWIWISRINNKSISLVKYSWISYLYMCTSHQAENVLGSLLHSQSARVCAWFVFENAPSFHSHFNSFICIAHIYMKYVYIVQYRYIFITNESRNDRNGNGHVERMAKGRIYVSIVLATRYAASLYVFIADNGQDLRACETNIMMMMTRLVSPPLTLHSIVE